MDCSAVVSRYDVVAVGYGWLVTGDHYWHKNRKNKHVEVIQNLYHVMVM